MIRPWLTDGVGAAVVAGVFGFVTGLVPVWMDGGDDDGGGRINCSLVHQRVYEFVRQNRALATAELDSDTTGDSFLSGAERAECPMSVLPVVDRGLADAVPKP